MGPTVHNRGKRPLDFDAVLLRIEDIAVLKPTFLQMGSCSKLALDDLDEAGGGAAVDVDAGIKILDRTRIGARSNREARGQDAHLARARGIDRGTGPRRYDADHGDGKQLLRDAKPRCGRRVAGDDHDLDIALSKPTARLHDE